MRICLILIAAITITTSIGVAEEATKPQRPEFRSRLSDADYRKQAAAFQDAIKQSRARAEKNWPVHGVRIGYVTPNGQLESLGMRAGDILTRIDEDALWTTDLNLPDVDGPRRLRCFVVAAEAMRTVSIQPGKIGFTASDYWAPEQAYLKAGPHRGKWDDDALLGILARDLNPDLAETAWHRAAKAGFSRNHISAQCGTVIALAQDRPAVATAYLPFLTNEEHKQDVHPLIAYRAAAAGHDLKSAAAAVKGAPVNFDQNPNILSYLLREVGSFDAKVKSPLLVAPQRYRDDLLPGCRGRDYYSVSRDLPPLQQGKSHTLSASIGHYKNLRFGPTVPIGDFDLRVKLTAKAVDSAGSGYMKNIRVHVVRDPVVAGTGEEPLEEEAFMLLSLREPAGAKPTDGCMIHAICGTPTCVVNYHDPTCLFDGKAEQELRLIRVGNRGEIRLNNRRVMLLPTNPTKMVRVTIGVTGAVLEIKSVKFDELIEKS